jgi:tRNA threonylcarbamoyladenosine biosynthesis protein TsaB
MSSGRVILLGIDTCGSVGTLALARVVEGAGTGLELLGSAELPGRSTAAMLVPQLGQMLLRAGLSMADVNALVVVDGPGSFTGIRIGLSTVKGLAEAGGMRVYAVSRLRVLARVNEAECAVLDAGRGEFYLGCYAGADAEWLVGVEELRAQQAGMVCCEEKVAAVVAGARVVAAPTAGDALKTALSDLQAGRSTEIAGLDGRYLRRTDLYRLAQPLTS